MTVKTKPEQPHHQRAYSLNQPRSTDDVLNIPNLALNKNKSGDQSKTPKIDKKGLKKQSSKKLVSVANQGGFDDYLKSEGY